MSLLNRFSIACAAISSALVIITGWTSPAHATCLTDCKADLYFDDCTKPNAATWPQGTPLSFTSSCQTCCSAPGGPLNCSPSPVDVSTFHVMDGNSNPIAGTFAPLGKQCADTDLFSFDGALNPGPHQLLFDNLILVQFDVTDAGGGGTGGSGNAGNGGMGSGSSSSSSSNSSSSGNASQGGSACSIRPDSSDKPTMTSVFFMLAFVGMSVRRRKSARPVRHEH